jgi:hypothetical protein
MQSSPGYLQVGHVPSKWTWQIPQTSSSGISHRQVATAFHFLILTFILTAFLSILYTSEFVVRFVGWRRKLEVGDVYFTSSRLPVLQSRSIFTCRADSYQQLACSRSQCNHTPFTPHQPPGQANPSFQINCSSRLSSSLPLPLTSTASPFSYYALPLFNRGSTTNATPITASR